MTAADVQRVAQTYFTPENRLVLTIIRAERHRRGPMMRRRRGRLALRRADRARRRAAATAQVPDWPSERPPRPLPAREVKFPPYATQDAGERAAGDRGLAPRAAGRQPAR